MYRSCRLLSATTESASQKTECNKMEPDGASTSISAEKQLEEVVEAFNKEKESLSKQVADFQVFSFVIC